MEGLVGNGLHRRRNGDIGQAATVLETVGGNLLDAIGDVDELQIRTILKGAGTNTPDGVREGDAL